MAKIRERLVATSVVNSSAALSQIKTTLTAAGWTTLYDNIASGKQLVMKSTGETAGKYIPMIVQFDNVTANKITAYGYTSWNGTSNTGTNKMGVATVSYWAADDDASFYMWMMVTKDSIGMITKVGTTYYHGMVLYATPLDPTAGVLQSAVTSGDDAVLTLDTGETDGFVVGEKYPIVGVNNEGQRLVTIGSVDSANDQITVDNLPADMAAGAVVGSLPWPYTYIFATGGTTIRAVGFPANVTTGTYTSYYYTVNLPLISLPEGDPDDLRSKYWLAPWGFSDSTASYTRPVSYLDDYLLKADINVVSYENTGGVKLKDSGTSTGSNTTTTLNDTGKSWTTDEFKDMALILTGGTGAGQYREITGNDGDTLTVDEAWATTPDDTTEYRIYKSLWFMSAPSASFALCFKIIGD